MTLKNSLKSLFSFLAILCLFGFQLQAQTISGTVLDAETGETLIGANVLVKGTTTGTISDIDGNFSLNANSVLIFL